MAALQHQPARGVRLRWNCISAFYAVSMGGPWRGASRRLLPSCMPCSPNEGSGFSLSLTTAPDRADDSDPLDREIRERFGVQLVAPHHSTRSKAPTQDGRVLRRYRRRWKIERLFAWLHNYRRVVIRWQYYPENFLGMVQLARAIITPEVFMRWLPVVFLNPRSLISAIRLLFAATRPPS